MGRSEPNRCARFVDVVDGLGLPGADGLDGFDGLINRCIGHGCVSLRRGWVVRPALGLTWFRLERWAGGRGFCVEALYVRLRRVLLDGRLLEGSPQTSSCPRRRSQRRV